MSHSASGSINRMKSVSEGKNNKQKASDNQEKNHQKEENSSSDDDDEPNRPPIQLKVEFVNSIMFRQWALAKKLCHFMLMYEPNNNEAKQYAPLIDYMLEKEQNPSSSSSDDDDDDDINDNDSSESSSSSSDSSLDEEEKQIDTTEVQTPKPTNASMSNKFIQHK
ncbi:unnamed protein product [Rotaria socialis]|uniref:Uncharacterized protein n=1 Tax=Rotaria socialis TaxID=392032 RepID=A0A820FTP1_9BILA|nr:unnamed protein product [Rotaria socialis]CAF3404416.1 unnamed protein product [Rotaria socialis]CAF3631986.1 unnamed protein product [Rotaria socialis]CAF4182588.1 unnamed protein product [Rotaria socialis]CAF4265326.1 unnamed protein product [Rotaria socialis]